MSEKSDEKVEAPVPVSFVNPKSLIPNECGLIRLELTKRGGASKELVGLVLVYASVFGGAYPYRIVAVEDDAVVVLIPPYNLLAN